MSLGSANRIKGLILGLNASGVHDPYRSLEYGLCEPRTRTAKGSATFYFKWYYSLNGRVSREPERL